jgi:hypothetical protein
LDKASFVQFTWHNTNENNLANTTGEAEQISLTTAKRATVYVPIFRAKIALLLFLAP